MVLAKCSTGRGWASVLNTQWSKGRRSSLENSRYKYLKIRERHRLQLECNEKVTWSQLHQHRTLGTHAEQLWWKTRQRRNLGHPDDLKHNTTCSRAAPRAPGKLRPYEASKGDRRATNSTALSGAHKRPRCRMASNEPLRHFSDALLNINNTNHVFWQLKQYMQKLIPIRK